MRRVGRKILLTHSLTHRRALDAGIDVTANQDDELTDKETFQIEFDTKKDQWRVRTSDNVCWKLADASGIQATDDGRSVTG